MQDKIDIFVFGSNLAGRHGKGAALDAKKKWGAIQGQGEGLQGRSYGIPTKDENLKTRDLEDIFLSITNFLYFARAHKEKYNFLVTKIGCGLAGYTVEQIAPMFYPAKYMTYIKLPEEFINIIDRMYK